MFADDEPSYVCVDILLKKLYFHSISDQFDFIRSAFHLKAVAFLSGSKCLYMCTSIYVQLCNNK